MPFTKKYIEVKVSGKVVAVLPINECSPAEFIEKQKEANKNLSNLETLIRLYKNKISELEKEIKFLKGEE